MEITKGNVESTDWRNLVVSVASLSVFGFAVGMTSPLLSLILASRGYSDDLIGLNAAMDPLGILLFSPIIPITARRFGARNVAISAALITVLITLAYKALPSLAAWFILRLLHGMAVSTLFVLSEAWIVRYGVARHRGRIVAGYASILAASFAAGPAAIGWIGIDGWWPFLIAAAVLIAAIMPLGLVHDHHHLRKKNRSHSFVKFASKAPLLLVAVGMFAVFDAATLNLLPVYALRVGLDLPAAATTLTVLIAGNIVLQLPIGYLADRWPKRMVLAGCAIITSILCLLIPVIVGSVWIWPLLLLVGATAYGIYTVALVELGGRFKGDELVYGAAAFATMWGSGALLGSVIGGWAMVGFGPHGLPISLAIGFMLLLPFIGIRRLQR